MAAELKRNGNPFNIACCKSRDRFGVRLEDIQDGLRQRAKAKKEFYSRDNKNRTEIRKGTRAYYR